MALSSEESTLKTTVLRLMKQHGKTTYAHAGVLITVVPGEEDVKIRIRPATADEAAEPARTTSASRDNGKGNDAEGAEA
jgi:hypothetical protein